MPKKTLKILEGFKAGQYVPDDRICYDEAEMQEFANGLSRSSMTRRTPFAITRMCCTFT